jgi:type III secretory pathway component EscR
MKNKPTKRFSIQETCVYSVHANSIQEAKKKFLNASSQKRDKEFFNEVTERDIRQEEPEIEGENHAEEF